MNKINMIKTVAVLTMVTLALTLTIVAASDWSQFQKDEVSIGMTADSAPITPPDDTTTEDVQIVLQSAADFDEGTESGNDAGYLHGLANWTLYDFDVRAGEDKWAFEGEVSSKPPTTNGVPSGSIGAYSNIRADDETYEGYVTSTSDEYAAQRFNFSIDDNKLNFITKINVTWNGRGYRGPYTAGDDDGATLYIWNGTGYEELANNSVGTDATLTGEVTSGISNYINAGNVTVLVEQKSADGGNRKDSHIETDYVRLVVTP